MPFSPSDVSGLHAWWKADSLALVDNDPVATWTDSSSSGFDGTQAASGARPTFKTAIVNSLPVLRFDGLDWLATSASASLAAQTLFAVARPTTTAGLQSMLASQTNGCLQWRFNSGKSNVLRKAVADIASGSTTVSTSVFQVLAATLTNGGTYAFYHNGAADGSGSHSETLTAGGTLRIGGDHEPITGDIAELIIYDSVLSTGDRAAVTSYLGTKYAIGVVGNTATFFGMF